jgi:hypothetical protein
MHALRCQARLDLGQRDVAVLGKHRYNLVRMNIGLRRALIATGLASNGAAMLAGQLSPADRCRDANSKTSRSRPTTHALVCRRNDTIPQILR